MGGMMEPELPRGPGTQNTWGLGPYLPVMSCGTPATGDTVKPRLASKWTLT